MKWQKGQSGNPSGRPKELREVVELARSNTVLAVTRLVYWAKSKHPQASPRAAEALLDRGWGKPTQMLGQDPENPFSKLSKPELLAELAKVAEEVKEK